MSVNMDFERMTIPTLRVIAFFLSHPDQEFYGLEIKIGRPVYDVLSKLESMGWLIGRWEVDEALNSGRRPRRYYRMTPVGVAQSEKLLHSMGLHVLKKDD